MSARLPRVGRTPPRTTRAAGTALAVCAALHAPAVLGAQDRLVGERVLGAGVTADAVWFGGAGVLQGALPWQDSVRLRRATQVSIPVTAAVPFGPAWTFDVTAVYGTGSVHYDRVNPTPGESPSGDATFTGPSDTRVRLTGRLLDDRFVVTAGLNVPTGRRMLDTTQLLATRALAAPALGMGAPPVGAGTSGTVGVLATQKVGPWAVAGGVSYERRGRYDPVAAFVAGVPPFEFIPGSVTRLSLGTDGLVGRGRMSIALGADFFGQDRLRSGTTTDGADPSAAPTLATVQLGPVLSGDVQAHLPAPAVRELVAWAGVRWRAPYRRDGTRVDGSDITSLDAGLRTSVPLTPALDVFGAVGGRYSSGLGPGGGLPASGYLAGNVTVGASHRLTTRLTAQPFLRAQVGRVHGRGVDVGQDDAFRGGLAGLTVLTRF